MNNSFEINFAVECVRTIVDNNRCMLCDKIEGSRLRYNCGHLVCDDCVAAVDCQRCLSPPLASTPRLAQLDNPSIQRAKHASALLKAFEDAFKIDVYKRHRLSEQLKVEKEIFPKCIQAPVKYSNKRKSFNVSLRRKENKPSILPGERISPLKTKMENNNIVQQWLDKNVKMNPKHTTRKALTDLDMNSLSVTNKYGIKKRAGIIDKDHENFGIKRTKRRRSNVQTSVNELKNQFHTNKYLKPFANMRSVLSNIDKNKTEFQQQQICQDKSNVFAKVDNNESGIGLDDDIIVIDDSQSQVIDKDKEAWLAVLAADQNVESESSPLKLDSSEVANYTMDTSGSQKLSLQDTRGVPFFKRGNLFKSCIHCNGVMEENEIYNEHSAGQSKDVSITIESSSIITTIKVSNVPPCIKKSSTSVQTDINGIYKDRNNDFLIPSNNDEHSNNVNESIDIETEILSEDLFTGEAKEDKYEFATDVMEKMEKCIFTTKEAKQLVIVSSDSDDDANESLTMQVTADIHQISNHLKYGVLGELDSNELRTRRPVKRRMTPGSTDSSEKENYDPNKGKRTKVMKKVKKKKKNFQCHGLFEPKSII